MSSEQRKIRWPDGASASLPTPVGRIGGTYYWNPGSPTAPQFTLTLSRGSPGLGANAVFLRQGMTSSDTLGYGVSGTVSTILPSVTLNSTAPSNDCSIPQPLKTRVTSVETGIAWPPVSAAITSTYSPQKIVDFLTRHFPYGKPYDPPSDKVMVRDSAAAARIPGRSNVFEYGFPEPSSLPPAADIRAKSPDKAGSSVFITGASPVPLLPPVLQNAPRGLPGLIAESLVDPSNHAAPPAGGLAGLIQDYLRNNRSD